MGLFSWLRTSEKAVDTGLDLVKKGADGIDMLIFTDEEKARFSAETMQLWLKTQEVIKDESSIRSVTRRILAVAIVGEFLLFLLMAGVGFLFNVGWAKYLLMLAQELSGLAMLVAGFYFGYYAVSNVVKQAKKH